MNIIWKNIIIRILEKEIEILKSRYRPYATGHLKTAVSVLRERIKELKGEVKEDL
mgnify:CR=1 FL=1|jgi:hypothetical protein